MFNVNADWLVHLAGLVGAGLWVWLFVFATKVFMGLEEF